MKVLYSIVVLVMAQFVNITLAADAPPLNVPASSSPSSIPSPLTEVKLPNPGATNAAITNTVNALPGKLKELTTSSAPPSNIPPPQPPKPEPELSQKAPPSPPPLPPLQPLPQLPSSITGATPPSTATPVEQAAAIASGTSKVEEIKKKDKERKEVRVILGKTVVYPRIHLPESINHTNYDINNNHLPEAQYEADIDSLVFLTAARDDLEGLKAMLRDATRSVEMLNVQGDTPLIVAVRNNAINTSRLLLALHADPYAQDVHGRDALTIAKQNNNQILVRAIESACLPRIASLD